MKKLFFIITIFFVISCDKTSKNKEEEKEKNIKNVTIEKVKPKAKPYLFKAKVNTSSGLVLRKDKSTTSEKLILIPKKAIVNITKLTDEFESLPSNKEYNNYGKWVEIEYLQPNEKYISGFVFDDFLDYQFNKKNSTNEITKDTITIYKDTITIYNELQFINALASNRVILIDANEINLEKYSKEYYTKEDSYIEDSQEQYSFEYHSLILSNYNNIEIKGKNRMVNIIVEDEEATVLTFQSCNNVFIDNIDFHHKVFTPYSCSGEVVQYDDCNNFNFQNVHFDGTGTIGCKINNSTNFNFLNCEFYRNSQHALFIEKSTEIVFNRCDIHNNSNHSLFHIETDRLIDHQSIKLENCYIKNNDSESVFCTENDAGEGGGSASLTITTSSIERNNLTGNIFDFIRSEDHKVVIDNSAIKNNTSESNKFIIRKSHNKHLNISLQNTTISNNIDFYGLTNETINKIKTENFTEKNIFNIASDTTYTKYNTYKKNGEIMFLRNENNINYNEETKQLSIKNHILEGLHRIVFSNVDINDKFYGFSINLKSNNYYFRHPFVCEGNIIDGKLEGLWIIKSEYGDDMKHQLIYEDGVLLESVDF